ncbi:hypothetical protein UFOVP1082_32 [uncultured Caudovirales phage]|uniref:Uncharacterized protein n=1 Tax=uncultured Caudovirales phage TaxID=2100421 RepID=A0A6J5RUR4_9CAUD|nr:hypothetical protein UFOVP906_10 [uncultured Caudovirales phage]CAB4176494.1 hypothetical protein UFOVP992_36 [uncultured Caudovirales phage]CAB4183356.1 hypothetical protein UFOVP1082_32 [uncultured Caudovirales phage]CAB4197348.1 hypothetical protein UFOVP1322_17 [uncultured Caudovirales phage]CAB4212737.1 hypothetical protein UFOVP1434_39 [uncultured Caudovirales phage]
MSNQINTLIARIEAYRKNNKVPCKNYATQAAAEKATAKMAQVAATHFDRDQRDDAPSAQYIVVFNEAWGRWVGGICLSQLMGRSTSTGGYLGICTGFFCY